MTDLVDKVRRMAALCRPGDQVLATLAGLQHGVVARWQLMVLGLTRDVIQDRVTRGQLHRVHLGVYAVGHRRMTLKGRWLAAVLACGAEAVLSHRHAVALWELRPASGGPIDVTVPGRTKRGRKGIRVHNVRALHRRDRSEVDGIPVTSVHRTLLDYAEVSRPQQLRLALEAAERRDLLDMNKFNELFGRSRGRRGLKPLRAAIGEMQGPAPWTQSELENAFLAVIREAGIEEPQANVMVAGYVVDFFWPRARLVVEVDGYEFHKSRAAWERDRHKDVKLQLARCNVVRATQDRIERAPRELVRDVLALLTAALDASRPGP